MASAPHGSSPFHHLLVFFLLFAAAMAFPVTSEFELGVQKRIHFRVYFHETFLGPDNTTVTAVNMSLPYSFGNIEIFDAVLRVGPDDSSTFLGRVQDAGFYISQQEVASLLGKEEQGNDKTEYYDPMNENAFNQENDVVLNRR
ncbi:hypothetical protein GW17_00059374 [Ensete ventricosum]|nr:hypothetical protein GW17_00059374 [Ensete ventricosum]